VKLVRTASLSALLATVFLATSLYGALPNGSSGDPEPSAADRQNRLGTEHAARGDFRQAAGAFRKAVDLDPSMVVAHYNLGLALSRVDNHLDAVFAFQGALRLAPSYFDAWFQLGLSLMATERFAEAATAFEECLGLRRGNAAARFRLGQSYWKAGKWAAVIAQWDSLLNESPEHPSTALVRAEMPRAYYNVGLDRQSEGDVPGARDAYEDALRRDAAYTPALNNLGVLISESGDDARAIELFKNVLEIEPGHVGAQIGIASALLDLNEPAKALRVYKDLYQRIPLDTRIHRGIVWSHFRLGNQDEALRWVATSLAPIDPKEALLMKAYVLEHTSGGDRYGPGYDEDAVIATYREVIDQFPDTPRAYHNLAVIHARSSRWAEAVGLLNQALVADPSYVPATKVLAEIKEITKSQGIQILQIK